jgi:hypothetical protein
MATDYEIFSPSPFTAEDRDEPRRFITLRDAEGGTYGLQAAAREDGYFDVTFGFLDDHLMGVSVTVAEGPAWQEFVAYLTRLRQRHPGLSVRREGGDPADEEFELS